MSTDETSPTRSRSSRRLVAPAAIAAAVLGGALGGAVLGIPGVSGAQDEPTTTTAAPESSDEATTDDSTTDDTTTDEADCDRGFGHHLGLGAAAEALGLTEDELRTQVQDGATLADVAAAQGVEVQALIDALVADAQTHLDEEVAEGDLDQTEADSIAAELTDRVTAMVNGELSSFGSPGFGGPRMGHGGPGFGHFGAGLGAAAGALGLTTDELMTQLQDGTSLADIAAAQGVEVQTLIDALVAEAQGRLDEAVAAGDLDQARADEIAAELTDRITAMVNGDGIGFGGPGVGGPGFGGPGFGGRHARRAFDEDGTATDDTTTDDATQPSSGSSSGSGSLGA